MIPKEEFLKAIEALKQQNAIDDNFQTHMEAAFPGSYAPIYENCLWELSIHLLELAMEDRYEYVSWWVYETDYGKREDMTEISWTEDGQEKSVKLTTAEALYDFLVENAKHNDSNEPIVSDPNTKTISMEEFMQPAERQILGKKEQIDL